MNDLKSLMEEYERTIIMQALAGAQGHQRRAARMLGLLPTTLHEMMKRLGIRTRTGILRTELGLGESASTESGGVQAA